MTLASAPRLRRLIASALERMALDLRGRIILTEAATGYFAVTPIIAALAGASQVLALAKDSRFGAAAEVASTLRQLADAWEVGAAVDVLTRRDDLRIGEADIVTNLGNVRPIDRDMLGRLKRGAAISLMWETWEFRSSDIDLEECRRLGIPLLGTDEHHPELDTFGYIGPLVLKLLLAGEIEIHRARVVVAGTGEFATRALAYLKSAGCEAEAIDTALPGAVAGEGARMALAGADALVIADHRSQRLLIGAGGDLAPKHLAALNPALAVVHLCGGVDRAALAALGLKLIPDRFAAVGSMSTTTADLGPKPLIDLHAAGLRVGAALRQATIQGLSGLEAEEWALKACPYAQGFAGRHSRV
jgi:hypothetical protein